MLHLNDLALWLALALLLGWALLALPRDGERRIDADVARDETAERNPWPAP